VAREASSVGPTWWASHCFFSYVFEFARVEILHPFERITNVRS
jgi:hypothetical protein